MFSAFRCRRKHSGLDGFRQFFSVSRSSAQQTFAVTVVSAPSARESTNQITQTPLLLMDSTSVSKRSVRTWTVAVKLSRLSSRIAEYYTLYRCRTEHLGKEKKLLTRLLDQEADVAAPYMNVLLMCLRKSETSAEKGASSLQRTV